MKVENVDVERVESVETVEDEGAAITKRQAAD
jgi:hypothetical protein